MPGDQEANEPSGKDSTDSARSRVVVGTAGHVDHGKTRLVLALTGIDCDRWTEEKTRGITIDLGFAHLVGRPEDSDDREVQLGFIDVPGHERFLNNALAGLGGVRIMLLVVSADEGVKPQTLEHLAICSLLEIPAAVVALTKIDAVDADLAELARLEIEELLEGTPFADAPILPVSAETGEGVGELKAKLLELAAEHAVETDPDRPARLPLDRSFHLKGLGVIVTGTLVSGKIEVGDTLEILPGDGAPIPVRVRSLQVHGEDRQAALPGERTSLQLAGAELAQVGRGRQIGSPGAFETTDRLLVEISLLSDAPTAIEGPTAVRVHLLSNEVIGQLRPIGREVLDPGDRGIAEIRLREPIVAVRGDHVILRRPSPETTLGGGRVIDPQPRRQRGADLAAGARQLQLDSDEASSDALSNALRFWVVESGAAGIDAERLSRRLGLGRETVKQALDSLVAEQKLLSLPAGSGRDERWIAPKIYARLVERAQQVLAEYFRRDRLSSGCPKAEAIERIFPELAGGPATSLADVYLGWLEKQKVITIADGRIGLPGRGGELTGDESKLAQRIQTAYEQGGLTPPAPSQVAIDLDAKSQIVDGIVRFLTERGRLVRLPSGLILAAATIETLRSDLLATGWTTFNVAQFKDHFGLSRKWAIPLLEHLDSVGATRRQGDERMVVGLRN